MPIVIPIAVPIPVPIVVPIVTVALKDILINLSITVLGMCL